jgi:hypothetical protein
MNAFEKLKALIVATEKDAYSFYLKGNKAAGVRLRKAFQQTKAIVQQGRNEVSELKAKK